MSTPTQAQIEAAVKVGRKAIEDYSSNASSMIPDDVLETFVKEVVTAALNVVPSSVQGTWI